MVTKLRTKTDETHEASMRILARLIAKPMRQSEICAYAIKDSVSIKKTIAVFYWLRDRGFIQKTSKNYCSSYEVTEKGKIFYRALTYRD
jgi:predicted transcriptional regulator